MLFSDHLPAVFELYLNPIYIYKKNCMQQMDYSSNTVNLKSRQVTGRDRKLRGGTRRRWISALVPSRQAQVAWNQQQLFRHL
jgi:hypothetical protein